MNWMSNRFARLRGVPRQQGADAPGPVVPEPRSEPGRDTGRRAMLPDLMPSAVSASRVLVSAPDDGVRLMLMRQCQMSAHLQVVEDAKEPISSLRAAYRLRPDLILVQVQSASETAAELIRAFKELSPESKIFAYSTLPGGVAVSAAIAAGADRYALAGVPLTALLREIEDLAVPDRTIAG